MQDSSRPAQVVTTATTTRSARRLALHAVKLTAVAADWGRRRRPGVVILLYHRVGAGSGLEIDLPVGLFADQMEYLAENRRVVSLEEALTSITADRPPDDDLVVLTFDDGTADLAEHALPVLDRCGLPVTIYLATDFIERGRPFPHAGTPLSWDALRDALSTGLVTPGSHTDSHAVMDSVDPGRVDDELDRSIELIEGRLGVTPRDFAYPKGVAGSAAVEAAIRRRFRSAALGRVGVNAYSGTDPYRLARSPIQVSDGLRYFARKADGGMALEGTLRRLLNRRRYAQSVT